MRRLPLLAVLITGFLFALSGVALAAEDVAIDDSGLTPTRIVVDIREPIVWTNNTDAPVSLVGEEPGWESGEIAPGATFSIEITQAGTYSYASSDGSLRGQIVVRQAGGGDEEATEDPDAGGKEGGRKGDRGGEADGDEVVDPDEEALPVTGVNAAVPGALSLLLMAFGGGLVALTEPVRRRS